MRRHPHQVFIRFLNAVEHEVPVGMTVHAINQGLDYGEAVTTQVAAFNATAA